MPPDNVICLVAPFTTDMLVLLEDNPDSGESSVPMSLQLYRITRIIAETRMKEKLCLEIIGTPQC